MGFLSNLQDKNKARIVEEINGFLLEGEEIENIYIAIVDFVCLTNKRMIFADKSGVLAKGDFMVSVPYKNIISVFTTKGGWNSFSDFVGFSTAGSVHQLKLTKGENAKECFKSITEKII
jgi:hypothetical protein